MFTALMLLPVAAAADAPLPSSRQPIVVTGERFADADALRHYVAEIATPAADQLARFHAPICPLVDGLPEPYAGRVAGRIRSVASRARIPVAGAGCRPNVTVVFTESAPAFVRQARNAAPNMFVGLEPAEIRRLLRGNNGVVAWQATEVRNSDGLDNGQDSRMGPGLFVPQSSIINLATRQEMVSSYVVIEQRAAEGKSLDQIADYAAVRLLAEVRPPSARAAAGSTILTLFEGGEAPRAATALDLAYLSALYRAPTNVRFTRQAAAIAALMSQSAAGAP